MVFAQLAFFAMVLGGVSGAASAQAIDCVSATLNHSEHAVCASDSLRTLAAGVDERYLHVAAYPGVKQSQLDWIRTRDRCNGNLACLTTVYRKRSAYLAGLPVTARSVPTANASAAPIRHLFLRHAPAQLLKPSTAPADAPSTPSASASERLERAAGPAPATGPAPHTNTLWWMAGVLFASILLWQMLNNVCGKCPNCHHWFARVEIDRQPLAGDAPELADRRRPRLDLRTVIGQLARARPDRGRKSAVRHYNQCRLCLHEWQTTTQEVT